MAVLLVHLFSDMIEASILNEGNYLMERSLPLHSDLKSYLTEANSQLASKKSQIDEVFVVFGVTFFKGRIRIIKENDPKPFKIDRNLLDKLISNTEEGYEIENKVLSSKINGYPVKDPLGKEGCDLELTVYQSKVNKEIIEELKTNVIPISKKISFHTFPYMAFRALSFQQKNSRSFIVIDVGKSITIFTLVNGENKIESTTVDKGTKYFIDEIMEEMNVDEKVAHSLLKMNSDGTLDDKSVLKIRAIIEKTTKLWESSMYKSLNELSEGGHLPKLIYLICPQEWKHTLVETVRHNEYNDFSIDDNEIEVLLTDHKTIDSIYISNNLL